MTFAGFTTRAAAGLTPARSLSRNITPGQGGVVIHYGGPKTGITATTPHTKCLSTWRSWQTFHIKERGWADIAYTGAACQHGYLLAGRGIGARTAANGTNTANQDNYALVWIGGDGDTPTQAALDALDEGIIRLRASGAGDRVTGHKDHKSTSCPGAALLAFARSRDRQPIARPGAKQLAVAVPAQIIAPTDTPPLLALDGLYGPAAHQALMWWVDGDQTEGMTRANVRDVQTWAGRERTGELSKADNEAIQRKVGAIIDGDWPHRWGTRKPSNTTLAIQRFLNRRINERKKA